ncbi:MAG TPA: LptF/LptG family permease [Bryobacteraceae bacterium]|jgi:LPS export ABC transporter permease LptG/LPS export ABC transporter permease LptF|nr:LptF/LptG family permease [Bryobacteraceae bacterium]
MKILSRYVFREVLPSAFLATGLATFIIFLRLIGRVFEIMIRSAKGPVVLELVALLLPPILVLSIPFGVLVGILVGLGRLSSDNEMVAMRSAGVSTRIVVAPVLVFAFLSMLVCGACSLWLNPLAIRAEARITARLLASQLTADVERGVFEDQFTNDNTVLYVDDVKSDAGQVTVWDRVFIADLTPPAQRKTGLKETPTGPAVTVAKEALAVPDTKHNRLQLTFRDYGFHDAPYHSTAPSGATALQPNPQQQQDQQSRKYQDMFTQQLVAAVRAKPKDPKDDIDARIELHRRFALPFACLMLAMVGIPLGTSSRKGGRSAGYVWAIFLAFFCYYVAYITLTSLARSRTIGVGLASWLPNVVFGVAGIVLMLFMERPGDRDFFGNLLASITGGISSAARRMAGRISRSGEFAGAGGMRFSIFQILDSYVLSNFLFYFVIWLAGWVTMVQVFTFFDILSDVVKNNIPMLRVLKFHFFLTPELIYDTAPESVLLAILVTFGVMTKNNEVTAFKACGISVRRLGLPVLLMSALLSAGLFAFGYLWLPEANQIQDGIHNEIKGRPVQTYLHPERKWVIHDYRVYYFKYFDATEKLMVEPYVWELDPSSFHLVKEISATSARWQQNLKSWVFEQGVAREICGVDECKVQNFTATTFPELTEVPEDFLKEVKQDKQMNYVELGNYIKDLRASRFDTIKLQVQYYKKFAAPPFALIMALISIPFGFLVGNRGAMAGVGVSIAIAMAYLGVGQLFEQIGNVNYLPPVIAAWAPDALFSLAGGYLMLRMRT